MNIKCSKTQDNVYALMHLASDYDEDGIFVDYSKPAIDVFIDAAAYHIAKNRDVSFLKDACLRVSNRFYGQPECSHHETTWIPRVWCCHTVETGLTGSASEGPDTQCPRNTVLNDRRLLLIRGFRVDRIGLNLVYGYDTVRPSAADLWRSPLGIYLRKFSDMEAQNLPVELFNILVGWNEVTKQIFLGSLSARKAGTAWKDRITWIQQHEANARSLLYTATISALAEISSVYQNPHTRHEELHEDGAINVDLFTDLDDFTLAAMNIIFSRMSDSVIVTTESGGLAHLPDCDFEKGDEVWVVLGCDVPVVLKQRLNGRYWHVCVAESPRIQEHALVKSLSSDLAPGDRVGEWIVEDIEVE